MPPSQPITPPAVPAGTETQRAKTIEQPPGRLEQPSQPSGETGIAPRRPDFRPENLDFLEQHELADAAGLEQAALVAAMFALREPDKFSVKNGILQTIADRTEDRLATDGVPLHGLTVHAALEEFHAYLQTGTETKIITELQKLPEPHRLALQQELLALILRGHVSGESLALVLGGGFQVKEKPSEAEGDPYAHLGAVFGAFHANQGKAPARVEFYTANLPAEFDIRYVALHEIAHSLILAPVKGGLVYRTEDLARLQDLAVAGTNGESGPTVADRTSPLDTRELVILERALGTGNRDLVKPFETPYVATLLAELDKNPTAELRRYVLNEMLAERLAAYLASDGSLADFLHKRLLYSSAVQAASGSATDPNHPAAVLAKELELLKIQARAEQWPYETLVPRLQEFAKKMPGLADFLAETIFLDRRFSRALRGPQNLPISLKDNPYRHVLLARLKGDQAPASLPTIAEVYASHRVRTTSSERLPLGQPLPARKDKTFWQVLADAFVNIMKSLGLSFS